MLVLDQAHGVNWSLYHADTVRAIQGLPDSFAASVQFSPPFTYKSGGFYIYSSSVADMGNVNSADEFFVHFGFLAPQLLRVTMPGRLCVIHCKDAPMYMNRDEAAGIYDLPGDIIRSMEGARLENHPDWRWVYHSRVTIWKDPVTERERTNNYGLLHKSYTDRAEVCRQGLPDYLLVFRKWSDDMPDGQVTHDIPESQEGVAQHYFGTNPPNDWQPRSDGKGASIAIWQKEASPVWFDIKPTDVLNTDIARSDEDERHICPMQLGIHRRCNHIWTMPGETVLDPFAGIGSCGVVALEMGRKFVGIELKDSYFWVAKKYLEKAERDANQVDLFEYHGIAV